MKTIEKNLPNSINIPKISKIKFTKETIALQKFINSNFKDHPGKTENFGFLQQEKMQISG